MSIHIEISQRVEKDSCQRIFRRDDFERIAGALCGQKGLEGEIEVSVLFCCDDAIRELNKHYRKRDEPTDVLSFRQDNMADNGFHALGDIVISLDTVEQRCRERLGLEGGELRRAIRKEVRLLFCHGVLHLLGYDHATEADRKAMQERQAGVLGILEADAWIEPAAKAPSGRRSR